MFKSLSTDSHLRRSPEIYLSLLLADLKKLRNIKKTFQDRLKKECDVSIKNQYKMRLNDLEEKHRKIEMQIQKTISSKYPRSEVFLRPK